MYKTVPLISILTFSLTACSGGHSGGGNTTQVEDTLISGHILKIGNVRLDTETATFGRPETVSTMATASFEKSSESMEKRVLELIHSINSPSTARGCSAYTQENAPFLFSENAQRIAEIMLIAPDTGDSAGITAGTSLVIFTPNGPWPELVMDAEGGYENYQTGREEYRPGYVPAGSSIDIPGDEFPAMTDVPLPTVEPVLDIASTALPVHSMTSGNTITWQAHSSSSEKLVTITFSVGELTLYNEGGGYSSERLSVLRCTAPDSGVFEVPPMLDELLGLDELSVLGVTIQREAFAAKQHGDALLLLGATSEATLELDI